MSTIFRDVVTINDFPFNDKVPVDGAVFNIDLLDGWDDTAEPRVETNEFGYSDGVLAAKRFPLKEQYYEIGGWVDATSRIQADAAKDRLADIFEVNINLQVVRNGPIPKAVDSRRVSKLEFPQDLQLQFRWMTRIMVEWPFKYNPIQQFSEADAFAGQDSYRSYDQASTVARTNLNTNPSLEVNAAAYNGSIVALRSTAWSSTGAASLIVTPVAAGGNDTFNSVGSDVGAIALGMVAGRTYTATATINTPVAQTGTLMPNRFRRLVFFYKVGTVYTETTSAIAPATGVADLSVTVAVPAGATEIFVRLYNGSGNASEVVYYDNITVEDTTGIATPGRPFDGATANDPTVTYAWTGTPHASTSTATPTALANAGGAGFRTYDASFLARYYQAVLPPAGSVGQTFATIANSGNADAYPIISVLGPLPARSWQVVNERTGEYFSFDLDISASTPLVVNTRKKTAFIGSESVEYFIRGDWLTAVPGNNTYRLLVADDVAGARLTIQASDTWKR